MGLYQARAGCCCARATSRPSTSATAAAGVRPGDPLAAPLPLTLDDDGYLVASGDFSSPIGPGFWNQRADGCPKAPLTARVVRWLDPGVGGGPARKTLDKVFPDHWSFLLGECRLYCFVILVLTGIYLSFFFDPRLSIEVI